MIQFTFSFHPNAYTDVVREKTIIELHYDDALEELLRAFPGAIVIDVFI
jgi:hypothetical protein